MFETPQKGIFPTGLDQTLFGSPDERLEQLPTLLRTRVVPEEEPYVRASFELRANHIQRIKGEERGRDAKLPPLLGNLL